MDKERRNGIRNEGNKEQMELQWKGEWFSVSEIPYEIESRGARNESNESRETNESNESNKRVIEWIEKDIHLQEKEREQVKSVEEMEQRIQQRTDWLESMVHQQAEMIQILSEEVGGLTMEIRGLRAKMMAQKTEMMAQKLEMIEQKEEMMEQKVELVGVKQELVGVKQELVTLKSESHSTSHISMTHLLDELKRVKERELNYALRRHQPVPYFDSGNLLRMVGSSIGSVPSVSSIGSVPPLIRQTSKASVPSNMKL